MKFYTRVFSFVLIILFQINTFSQIPNAGFENWTDGNPDDWFANNFLGLTFPITQSSTSHSGTSAIKLEVVDFSGIVYLPQLWSGEAFLEGFPVNQSFGSLTGFYQLTPNGNDGLFAVVWMVKEDQYIGAGSISIMNTTSSYAQFTVPIEYYTAEVPDTAVIWFVVGGDSAGEGGNVGSFALIDDLSWGPAVGIQEISKTIPEIFELKQNYPNPFNPSTKINFSITEQSYVELIIYDLLGREIERLVSDNYSAGEYSVDFNADNLPNGIYIAKMNAGKYSKAIKMTLLK